MCKNLIFPRAQNVKVRKCPVLFGPPYPVLNHCVQGDFHGCASQDATIGGHPYNGDGCHCSFTGFDAMVPHVADLLTELDADFVMTDSCICAIGEDGSSVCFHYNDFPFFIKGCSKPHSCVGSDVTHFHQHTNENGGSRCK